MDDGSRLRAQAQPMLEDDGFAGLVPGWSTSRGATILRFYPSFHQWQVWAYARDRDHYRVAALRWSVADDLRRFLPKPDIGATVVVLPLDELGRLDDDLGRIVVPVFEPVNTAGCDGATFAIERPAWFRHGSVGWWSQPPAAWQDLGRWFAATVAVFNRHLPATFTAELSDYLTVGGDR